MAIAPKSWVFHQKSPGFELFVLNQPIVMKCQLWMYVYVNNSLTLRSSLLS